MHDVWVMHGAVVVCTRRQRARERGGVVGRGVSGAVAFPAPSGRGPVASVLVLTRSHFGLAGRRLRARAGEATGRSVESRSQILFLDRAENGRVTTC